MGDHASEVGKERVKEAGLVGARTWVGWRHVRAKEGGPRLDSGQEGNLEF